MAIEYYPPLQLDYTLAMDDISRKIDKRWGEGADRSASRYIGEFCLKHTSETREFKDFAYYHARTFEPNGGVNGELGHTKAALGGMLFAYAMNHSLLSWKEWADFKYALPALNRREAVTEEQWEEGGAIAGKGYEQALIDALDGDDPEVTIGNPLTDYIRLNELEKYSLEFEKDDEPGEVTGVNGYLAIQGGQNYISRRIAPIGLALLGEAAASDAQTWAMLTHNQEPYHQSFVDGFGYMAYAGIQYLHQRHPDFYEEYEFRNAESIGRKDD